MYKLTITILAALTLAGCAQPVEAPPDLADAATTPAAAAPKDAAQVAAILKQAVPTATTITTWTAETDPNHLLGRPGGYTSAATVLDRRTGCTDLATSCGATVEVFSSAGDAAQRSTYILGLLDQAPMLGTEYHHLSGPTLVRVSGKLTPAQAAKYQATGV